MKPIVILENYAALAGCTEKVPDGNVALAKDAIVNLGNVAANAVVLGHLMDGLKREIIYGKPMPECDKAAASALPLNFPEADPPAVLTPYQYRLLHAAMGMFTESVEMLHAVMNHIYGGQPLDPVNLVEEGGDYQWYNALALNVLGVSLQAQLQANIDKLFARYGEKYSNHAALNRDLDKERQVLESGITVPDPVQ